MIEDKLYEYPYIMGEVKKLKEETEAIAALKYDTSITPSYSSSGHGGGISDKTGDQVIKIDELFDRSIEAIHKKIERLMNSKSQIDLALEELDALEKVIIQERYFKNESWSCISVKTKNSISNCHNLKNKALNKLKKKIVV